MDHRIKETIVSLLMKPVVVWTLAFTLLAWLSVPPPQDITAANPKFTDKAVVTPVATDNFVIVDDPGGTPVIRRATVSSIPVDISQLEGSLVAGDILYASGVDTVTRLAAGSDTEVLTLASGLPSWAAAGSGGTVQGTDATYDIQPADEGAVAGNARGEYAVDLQTLRSAASQVASVANGTISGGGYNTVTGTFGTVGGGQSNWVIGQHGTIGGGSNQYAQGIYSTVAGGQSNNAASGADRAAILGGNHNTANAINSSITGGARNTTASTADYSQVGGYYGNATLYGQNTYASGRFAANGDAQASVLVARISTTDGTQTEIFLDGTGDRCVIASDTTWLFRISLVARRTDADNESFGATYEGVIDNNAGTTALVGSVTETVHGDDPVGAWTVSVTADDTNDSLKVEVTGEVAKTIRWVARIELTEVTG